MEVWHSGTNKPVALKQPQQFMADEREAVEEHGQATLSGLFDPGIYQLGDTLSAGPKLLMRTSRFSRRNSSTASVPGTA